MSNGSSERRGSSALPTQGLERVWNFQALLSHSFPTAYAVRRLKGLENCAWVDAMKTRPRNKRKNANLSLLPNGRAMKGLPSSILCGATPVLCCSSTRTHAVITYEHLSTPTSGGPPLRAPIASSFVAFVSLGGNLRSLGFLPFAFRGFRVFRGLSVGNPNCHSFLRTLRVSAIVSAAAGVSTVRLVLSFLCALCALCGKTCFPLRFQVAHSTTPRSLLVSPGNELRFLLREPITPSSGLTESSRNKNRVELNPTHDWLSAI